MILILLLLIINMLLLIIITKKTVSGRFQHTHALYYTTNVSHT